MNYLLQALRLSGVTALILGVLWLMFRHPAEEVSGHGQVEIKVGNLLVNMWPTGLANGAALAEFERENPNIVIRKWARFRIPGDLDIASELMAFAARTAPDVTFTYVHRLQFYVEQGFLQPLNEFIGEDENGDGVLEPSEVRWKPWLDIPPMFRQLGMRGTKIYALPFGNAFSVMIYNPALFRAAGLDPRDFPKDFPSFFRAGQKICALSLRNPGGPRIYAMPREFDQFFQMLLLSAGGTLAAGDIYGPQGELLDHLLPEDSTGERIHALGFNPSQVSVKWHTTFDQDPVRRALEAIWKLCWQPWILDPNTGEPLDLTEKDIQSGEVLCSETGRRISLSGVPGGVQYGICMPADTSKADEVSDRDLLQDGAIAVMTVQNTSVGDLGKDIDRYEFALPPSLDVGGSPAVIAIPLLYGLNADLSPEKLKAAWKYLSFYCGPDWSRTTSRYLFDHDYAQYVSPLDAERLGFKDDLAKMPENWVRVNHEAARVAHVIPYFSGYQQAETEFLAHTTHKISDSSRIDIGREIRDVQHDIEERVLRPPGESSGTGIKLFAIATLVVSLGAMVWGISSVAGISRRLPQTAISIRRPGGVRLVFWLFVLPAIASVLLWNYYPMIRGFLLAFQEYRLGGSVKWVGLANFIEGAGSERFWYTIWNSIKFVLLNLCLGFFAPIGLAVLLNEIPRGKYFFRTIYFLPSVTSSLVIMLLWMVLYEPSPEGLFNQLLKPLIACWNHLAPHSLDIEWPVRWLQNPKLAMICVILPSIWAGMGAGSLIYLAALQSVSPDLYEAAEIDGAGFWQKLVRITIPYLRPLLLINLIGAFIGSAHGWSNIFIMTGGGPDLSTQVAALEIWMNSFVFLRFGLATAQAWILSSMLIGFTVWQIKQMQKVDFRRAGRP